MTIDMPATVVNRLTFSPAACDAAHALLLDSARGDTTLMGALAAADNMASFSRLQAEWLDILGEHPEFADVIESDDPYVCSMDSLAALIAQAPSSAIRQVLREVAHCRAQVGLALGLAMQETEARTKVVLAGAAAEWEILLAAYPMFSAWLIVNDRFTCSRLTLVEGMLYAPSEAIRHVLRETYCFREVAALATPHDFS